MPQFLVAIQLPDDFDPASQTQARISDISALNVEMIDAGVRAFVAGLQPPAQARTLRDVAGSVQITDGPFAETKEHIGGFWVLDVEDLDAALEWAAKAVKACGVPVEVREIMLRPPVRS